MIADGQFSKTILFSDQNIDNIINKKKTSQIREHTKKLSI